MCQIMSFNFWVDFLNNVTDGKVFHQITARFLVFFWKKYIISLPDWLNVPVWWGSFKYRIQYQLNDTINRFRPLSNTCRGVAHLTLPIVEKYKERRMYGLMEHSAWKMVWPFEIWSKFTNITKKICERMNTIQYNFLIVCVLKWLW